MARRIVEDWSASGMPIDFGKDWTDRLDQVEALTVSKKISAGDRSHLAAFPEIVALTHLILDPPTTAIDPREFYLATTAELSRRFTRIYTARGAQGPSTGGSASIAIATSAKAGSFENLGLRLLKRPGIPARQRLKIQHMRSDRTAARSIYSSEWRKG